MELPLSHHIGETDYGEKSHLVRSNAGMHLLTKPSRELYIYIYILLGFEENPGVIVLAHMLSLNYLIKLF